jgi:hypothetical protein
MKRSILAAVVCASAVVGNVPPVHAATIWSGVCTIDVTLKFGTNKVRLNSGVTSVFDIESFATNNWCEVTNGFLAGTGNPSLGFDGSGGGGDFTTCEELDGGGTFDATFSGSPAVPDFGGAWGFNGTFAGGVLTLVGSTSGGSLVAAVAVLVGDPVPTSCASIDAGTGVTSIHFTGALAINDPSVG